MLFMSSNWRDIERYYHGTWVKFQEFGDTLYHIRTVKPSNVTGTDQDGNEFILYLDDAAPYNVDYILPSKAVFQYKDQAYLLRRVPARQYKRGLCPDNTHIVRTMTGEVVGWSVPMLVAYVTKQSNPTLKEAMFGKNKAVSLALNRRFSFNKRDQAIMLDMHRVATYNRTENTLSCHRLFVPEIKQLISADPFDVRVIQ